MFDVNDFMNSATEAVLDTKFNQLDEGEYKAQIGTDEKAIEIKSDVKDGKPWAQIAIKYEIVDPTGTIEAKLGRKPTIVHRFFLDLKDDGRPDYGPQRNVRLGQVLAACNLKTPWKPNDLKGKVLKIKVMKVKNDRDPSNPLAEVSMVGVAN